jgi:hypothetical protein
MLRPALLDDNEAFDMSKPFLVSERLDALAYHMSLTPLWERCVESPSTTENKSTNYVEHDDQYTTKPLQGPPLDFIHELLQVTIDFGEDSLLTLALKDSCSYYSLRSCLTAKTMPHPHHFISDEDNCFRIVDSSLHTLIPLAAVSLLQLWIHDGASNDARAFHTARDILMYLRRSTAVPCDYHTALGPKMDEVPVRAMSPFAMVERIPKSFVEEVIVDGPPFYRIQNAFIDKMSQSDGKLSLCGWHDDELHLLAQVSLVFFFSFEEAITWLCQMKVQSLRARSGLSLCTALHAFNMVALVQDGQLYVTRNLTPHLGKVQQDFQTNRKYLEIVLIFLTVAIAKSYPQTVPPGRRDRYSQLFTPTPSQSNSSLIIPLSVSSVIRQSIIITTMCRDFGFRLWPKMIRAAKEFSVSFGGGSFKRTDGG